MDKITTYKNAIKSVLNNYYDVSQNQSNRDHSIQTQLVIDDARGYYFLLAIGWQNNKRVYGATMHFDLIDDKIWIQINQTDFLLADELIQKGVAKEDIVLGFHAPYKRQFTEYAMA